MVCYVKNTLIVLCVWYVQDDVIEGKHFPRNWPFVGGIHRSLVNSPPKGRWRGALKLFLISTWTNGWVSNRESGDLRRHRANYGVTVMECSFLPNDNTVLYVVYPIQYAQSFILRCHVVIFYQFLVDSYDPFTQFLLGYFTGTGPDVWWI